MKQSIHKEDEEIDDDPVTNVGKEIGSLFRKPKFTNKEKFVDDVIKDPESFGVLHSAIDALIQMRSKLPNQYVSYIQIYSSLLKTLYIYEEMIKSVHRMSDAEFKYMSSTVIKNCKKTIKNVDFKAIEKRVSEKRLSGMKKTDSGLSYTISETDTDKEKKKEERKNDYIG